MGFKTPTPIQTQAIPKILSGSDLIACAQTGTGKTAAYLLPVMDKIMHTDPGGVNTLIIAPTRELALQIDEQVEAFSYFCDLTSIAVYGGGDAHSWETQKRGLVRGADIVIATPGRLLSHLNLGYVELDTLSHFILDEADRMLDMGFHEDITKIIGYLPEKRQNLLFSATMPPKIRQLAQEILVDPDQVNIAISKPAEGILQGAYMVYDKDKLDLLISLLEGKDIPSVLVFAGTKSAVKGLEKAMQKKGLNARAMHSDLEQSERGQVMNEFANRNVQVLVATDIVSRGIDIENINLVINYDVPQDAADYVHRIGRTARAESTGVALTFINDKDQERFARIEKLIERTVNKTPLPDGIATGPEYSPRISRGRSRKKYSNKKGGKKGGRNFKSGNRRR
jgi:superfamily II DNA/RNA helicase